MKTDHADHIEIISAGPDQEGILSNLLELYVYEFSELLPLDLDENGRFGYKHLPLYWRESARYPFIVRVNGKLAGLVFVKRGSDITDHPDVWEMAEFFIVRRYRRRGIGNYVASDILRRFTGVWEIRVMERNKAAHRFWERAISNFMGKAVPSTSIQKGATCWCVFEFESKRG